MAIRRLLGFLASIGLLAALAAPKVAAAPPADPVIVRVATFNILYGGDEIDPTSPHGRWCVNPAGCIESIDLVVDAIRASGADTVGMQEGTGNACRIADALGWDCAPRLQIISRFPLLDPPGADGLYVYNEVAPGRVMAIANVHLTSDPYGPYFPREGWTLDAVLALEEELRLPEIAQHRVVLPELAAAGIPVVMTGDVNSPSHLDWTEAVSAVRPVEVPYSIDWPVAAAMADAGLRDAYRDAHPDPVADPGFTWTPGYPRERKGVEVHDRIDLVLHGGPSTTIDAELVGESAYPGTDIAVDPWPSDHRAVVATLEVQPAIPPAFATPSSRRAFIGEPLKVTHFGSGAAGERVAIVPAGGSASSAIVSASTGGATSGSLSLPTTGWGPGAYDVVLVEGGAITSGRSTFHLYPAGTEPSVRSTATTYRVGDPIGAEWAAGPGWKWDWLAITKRGAGNVAVQETCTGGYCGDGDYLVWRYVDAAVQGSATFDASTAREGATTWPLKQGWYRVVFYFDDGYQLLAASAPFRVVN
jgi:hypothetical protein